MPGEHGTYPRYLAGCRCGPCEKANTAVIAARRQPRVVVCCERELLEDEGAGHDLGCPA